MQTHLDLPFADGEYTFRLPLPQIAELQRKTGLGIGALFAKVLRGRYVTPLGAVGQPMEADFAALEVLEPIRLGLIGGGKGVVNGETVSVTPSLALELMATYTYPARPLSEAWSLAAAILMAAVEGWEEPEAQKKSASESPEAEEPMMDGSIIPSPSET